MSSIAELATVLRQVASPGIKPKELIDAVREKHPDVTKKEIVRAAFFALLDGHGSNAKQSDELHDFALKERGKDEASLAKPGKAKKKKARREPRVQNGAA